MISHLLDKLPASRLADWKFPRMSVCIAMIANNNRSIVTVADMKVTFGNFSADNTVLKDWLVHNCSVQVVGNDIEHAWPIMEEAHGALSDDARPSITDVVLSLDEAFGNRLRAEIERRVLRKRGFTAESFREEGKAKCSPSAYASLCSRIDQVSISLRFLVSGFDESGLPHIYCVDGEGVPKNYDTLGMWAIGSGAHAALSYLAFHADREGLPPYEGRTLEKAIYFTLAAKFMSESCAEVGKSTFISINELGGRDDRTVEPEKVDAIKMVWEAEDAPSVPVDLDKRVAAILRGDPRGMDPRPRRLVSLTTGEEYVEKNPAKKAVAKKHRKEPGPS